MDQCQRKNHVENNLSLPIIFEEERNSLSPGTGDLLRILNYFMCLWVPLKLLISPWIVPTREHLKFNS